MLREKIRQLKILIDVFSQRLQIRNMPRKQLEFREKIINVKIFRKNKKTLALSGNIWYA